MERICPVCDEPHDQKIDLDDKEGMVMKGADICLDEENNNAYLHETEGRSTDYV